MLLNLRRFAIFSALLLASALFMACYATETVIYSQGFESNNGNFTHTGLSDSWEWGTPSANFLSGPRAAHSGSKCWGTDLDDTVPYTMNAYLVSPAIVLPTLNSNQVMRVRFFGWIAVDLMYDRGQFQISSNGYDWETKTELLQTMQGGWNEYVFDISEFSGDTIFLRFRCNTDNVNNFDPPDVPYNMAGFYIDDIAITVTDAPAIKKTLTLEASENQSSIASCPWIFTKELDDKGNVSFKRENDVYSTARGAEAEYTDYYLLNHPLTTNDNGRYVVKLKETDQEESFTDLFKLLVIDHPSGTEIAVDDIGNIFTFRNKKDPVVPSKATDQNGKDVVSLIKSADEIGYKAYNGNYIDLDFSSIGNVTHPIFLLRAQGFMIDSSSGKPTGAKQPRIFIQTQNASAQWVTRNIFYPRWKSSLCGYDMQGLFPYSKKIRLLSASCQTGKYHLIDWAALSIQAQKSITISELTPASAIRSDGKDVTGQLTSIDSKYAHLTANEEIVLKFDSPALDKANIRDFIVKTRGYYIPGGTYFVYTWDGSKWVQRDGWTIPYDGDQTRDFDFSLWLPDPCGQNRVRIWQDFIFDPASIDFVGLKRDSISLIMNAATDLRNNNSILNLLNTSDNQRLEWDWGEDWPLRDRWVEVNWVDSFVNTPPSTNPISVTNTGLSTPTINWTYNDIDGNPQKRYEVEVWTGPSGTGNIMWDPQPWQGSATSVIYAGAPLTLGQNYFARVKAFDSLSWGGWSEMQFSISSNNPPVANAGNDTTVIAVPTCVTSVELNGSRSYDPDGDTLSYLWTGPFGTMTGKNISVFLSPDTAHITLIVSDGKGGCGIDSVTIVVRDTIPPIPDSASLPVINGACMVSITIPPTATDNCSGIIVGKTDSLVFTTPGTRNITWRFTDKCGNRVTQQQTVIVLDDIPPVPDVAVLPSINGNCSVTITSFPTATDNCAGKVTATTLNPLSYSAMGTYTITWQYSDASGNITTQQQSAIVSDNIAPVPDVSTLPVLQNNCVLNVTTIPTATDNCKGLIVGTTSDPLLYKKAGTYTINWHYSDGNGNITSQPQTAIVIDNTAPTPDVNLLPPINGVISGGRCYTVRTYPSATDNCKGQIIGAASGSLQYCNRGTFTIVWLYDDGNGNITSQNQIVNIR